jgi:oligopeptide transport system substrate-binding protein
LSHHAYRLLILGCLLVALTSVACDRSTDAPERAAGNYFRVNLGTEPPSLDWSLATDHVSFNVISNLMVGLAEFDKELKPGPVVARKWELQDGGRTIVFSLRDDVLWSDGRKVRAQDFEYSWKRLLNPKTGSEYAYILFDIVNAQEYHEGKLDDPARVGVRALDDFTLEVRLRHPASYFLAITTFEVTFPQRQDIVEQFESQWTNPSHIVTNGPYLLTSWKHENEIELTANPRFFLGKPTVEKIRMFMINEKTTALAMYEQGQLDFLDNHSIPIFEKDRLSNQRGFKRVPQLRGYYYGFRTDRPPFDDPRVRQAFMMALDRRVFPSILQGGEIPAPSWIPPGMPAHNRKIGLPFNAVEARRLLREAGYPDGKGFPPVVLAYNTEEDHKLVAEAAQGMWQRNLGVIVRLENQEWKVYLTQLRNNPPHIFRLGWGADYPDPDNFMKLFTSNSGNNHTRWKNKQYDQLLEQAARELDPNKRAALYDQAQRILCETELPIMPLFWVAESTLLSPHFTGLELTSMARFDLKRLRPTKE